MPLLTFDEVLAETAGQQRTILLGNGFSIGAHPDFRYNRLLDRAQFGGTIQDQRVREAFDIADSVDFESVVELLRRSAHIAGLHGAHRRVVGQMLADAEAVRAGLAEVVAEVHPDRIGDVGEDRLQAAADFLDHFDAIFTLCYDVILYWAFLRLVRARRNQLRDGFTPWNGRLVHENPANQTVSYLHGAIHLLEDFDPHLGTSVTVKQQWNGLTPLLDRVRHDLDAGRYPLVVMEGRWEAKLARIQASPYLSSALLRLETLCTPLVTLGWSLGEMDQHLVDAVGRSDVTHLYVGIHGVGAGDRALIEARAGQLQFDTGVPVTFYDSTTARVWDP